MPLTLTAITLGFVSAVANPAQLKLVSTRIETERQFSWVYQPPIGGERSGQQGTRFESRPADWVEQI
ncbi:MAG: hypothetical protein AAF215_25185 [Cyanobacteria bacterium P01_A01_bin.123]